MENGHLNDPVDCIVQCDVQINQPNIFGLTPLPPDSLIIWLIPTWTPPHATIPNTMPQPLNPIVIQTWWRAPLPSWNNNHWPYTTWSIACKELCKCLYLLLCTLSTRDSCPPLILWSWPSAPSCHGCCSKSGTYPDFNTCPCHPLETVASLSICLLPAPDPNSETPSLHKTSLNQTSHLLWTPSNGVDQGFLPSTLIQLYLNLVSCINWHQCGSS